MADINFNKKNVQGLIETASKSKFVIPEYQRPYSWGEDEIRQMFDDFVTFTEENIGNDTIDKPYFFGSVVCYKESENAKRQEIIDGQQRITSLFLFLRAIYTKLQSGQQNDKAKNFANRIENLLWEKDKFTGKIDFDKPLLYSEVISDDANLILENILKTGKTLEGSNDTYSTNYKLFVALLDEYAQNSPMNFYQFILNVLDNVIMFPIESNDQDTALTIFSTLNDRGMPLEDADIFKAKLYKKANTEKEKKEFIEKWKELDEKANNAGVDMQEMFYYEMFYLRAKEGDVNTTTIGLRRYFEKDKYIRLNNDVLNDIDIMLDLWQVIIANDGSKKNVNEISDEKWAKNKEILKVLDILYFYPNEFWKYPINIYYLTHSKEVDFEEKFEKFLKRLCVELLRKFIEIPSINPVKPKEMVFNASIIKNKSTGLLFGEKKYDYESIKDKFISANRKIVAMLLRFFAYCYQDDIIKFKMNIEHILPKKYKDSFFDNVSEEEINKHVEYIGNKILFEKKLNIIAGNGYFGKKKEYYKKSNIKQVVNLAKEKVEDWKLEEIDKRNEELFELFKYKCEEWIR